MWEHYKKRFLGMQLLIAIVTSGVYLASGQSLDRSSDRSWVPAAMFFITMQLGAVLGAAWATRLKRKYLARGW